MGKASGTQREALEKPVARNEKHWQSQWHTAHSTQPRNQLLALAKTVAPNPKINR